MERPCLKVFKGKGETARRDLQEKGFLDNDFLIRTEGKFILLPLKDGTTLEDLQGILQRPRIEIQELEKIIRVPRSYKDLTNIPEELRGYLPSSFDMIGDVLVIKLPDELLPFASTIGSSLLECNRHARSIALDRGVKGDLRVRELVWLSGRRELETVHVENNLRFKLDPSIVYFSPRLSTERMRIARLTQDGESVLDMFCGVGPFALTVAAHGRPEKVVGIDINPDCIRYFETNIALNNAGEKVEAFLGDSREVAPHLGTFQRVIMNLPHSSIDFLATALTLVEKGHIHLYTILDSYGIMRTAKDIMLSASSLGRKVRVAQTREVHQYSPVQHMIAFDLEVAP